MNLTLSENAVTKRLTNKYMRYNTHLIKARHSYTIQEIAEIFSVSSRTCFRWTKQGLRPMELNTSPLLFMGYDLINFIKSNQQEKRTKLKNDEYYCLKCKKAVKAMIGTEQIVKTGKKIGKENVEQYKKTALCEFCKTKTNRYLGVSQKD